MEPSESASASKECEDEEEQERSGAGLDTVIIHPVPNISDDNERIKHNTSHRPSLLRTPTLLSSVDSAILESQQHMSDAADCLDNGFISQLDPQGNIRQVPVKYEDPSVVTPMEDGSPNSISDFISTDILTKPFNFVSGNASGRARFNPFRKKSGLLNVLAKQATRNRIVSKSGNLNTMSSRDGKTHHLLKDIFITIIDLTWRWIFLLFAATFMTSWIFFASLWYATLMMHGDFDEHDDDFVPCVSAIKDFSSCFLFSIETQHTIGYGTRAITEECPLAIMVLCLQSIVGVIIQACMAGVIVAKFTIPRARGETIIFSKNAVITQRNGQLYLLCRISDLRKASLLEAHVRMIIIASETTDEGEVLPYQQRDLECGSELEGSNDRVLMLWPITIAHKIDEESPFFAMGPRDVLVSHFELIVTLEGVTEETGNTIQARTSYLPNEILWGHHFDNSAVAYDKKHGVYSVQHACLNRTVVDLTPRYSARQLRFRSQMLSKNTSPSQELHSSRSQQPIQSRASVSVQSSRSSSCNDLGAK